MKQVRHILTVTFTRGGEWRKLRFSEPKNVSVGFDDGHNRIECGEMLILDIADRQLDGLNVQVTDGGASGTPLRLYAKSVIEVALTIDAAQQIVGRERRKPLNCGLRIANFGFRSADLNSRRVNSSPSGDTSDSELRWVWLPSTIVFALGYSARRYR